MKLLRKITHEGVSLSVPSHLAASVFREALTADDATESSRFAAALSLLEGCLPDDVDVDDLTSEQLFAAAVAVSVYRTRGELPKKPEDTPQP